MSQTLAKETDDDALAERVRRGLRDGGRRADAEAAFLTLYERHARALLAYLGRLAHPSAVEDIAQDVWKRVWEKFPDSPGGPFRPWLFRVAHNRVVDQWRDAARRKADSIEESDQAPAAGGPAIEQTLLDEETRAAVARCLEKLPANQAELLRLRWRGESYDAICTRQGIDHNQAYKAYHHASRQVAGCVQRSGVL